MRRSTLLILTTLCLTTFLLQSQAANARAVDAGRCAALAGRSIPAVEIGLPTSGGRIMAAALVPTNSDGTTVPEHCLVSGQIGPVDRTAPNIEFKVALPAIWNGKAVMFGGGGLNGSVPNVVGNQLNASAPTPLARGYAVFGSDSGHQGGGPDFALNTEAWANYRGDALKKTRDAAVFIIARAYDAKPARAYFLGTSKGGAEALMVAARWPADWDGVASLYPARNGLSTVLGLLAANQAFATPGAFPSLANRALMYEATVERCDGLDGLEDGVISDVRGCHAAFDPATATLKGKPLRCPEGTGTPGCLSDAELTAFRAFEAPSRLPVAVGGEKIFPGFNAYTADTGRPGSSPAQMHSTALGFGFVPPASPMGQGMSVPWGLVEPYLRVIVLRDPASSPLKLDLGALSPEVKARIKILAKNDDADLDMAGFARKGGKVLLMHGTDDMIITPRGTETYYKRLRARLGGPALDSMMRYYEAPAFGHSQSAIFGLSWDYLATLENWVERGVDPAENEVMTDTTGVAGRTRPFCLYPRWPKYRGSGDVNAASSFECAAH